MAQDKIRAVFYARVSTDKEQQENALVGQIAECKDTIRSNGWILVDQYVDDGISGTSSKKRDEYRRLFEDITEDKFDIIVIKSQDRLMRNTKDWYIFVDRLVTNDIKLYMYLDNQFYHTDNSLITGIKAIMAEEYSRDLSRKLNNSNKRRIERAKAGEEFKCMGSGATYGFSIVNGEWFIDEEQAEIVRETFMAYDRFHSITKTRDYLNEKGYKNQNGRNFVPDTIRRILRNEMHKGVLVLNRNYRDFDKKKILTKPKEEWVYIYDKVPAIVDTELWDRVNRELDKHINPTTYKGKKNSMYPFSAKIYCKHCGAPLWATNTRYKLATGEQQMRIQWRCSNYLQKGKKGCDNPTSISDLQMRKEYAGIFEDVEANKKQIKKDLTKWLEGLKRSLRSKEDSHSIADTIEKLKKQKNRLTEAYMEEIISKEDYRIKYLDIEKRVEELEKSLVPEYNEDIEAIDVVLANIDKELDEYVTTQKFEDDKIDWFIDHTEKITVEKIGEGREPKKKLYVELDTLAGAIMGDRVELSVSNGKYAVPPWPSPSSPTWCRLDI